MTRARRIQEADKDPSEEVRQFLVRQPLPRYPTTPHEVVAEAVRIALQREGLDITEVGLEVRPAPKSAPPGSVTVTADVGEPRSARALATASQVLEEIATVREIWRYGGRNRAQLRSFEAAG